MKNSPYRLLLIDDDEVDRLAAVRLLKDHYELVEAETASQGLRILQGQDVDCVLLDYQLPDADGLSLIPQIAQQNIPVVMLTGMGNEQVAVDALKMGAQDYLIKGMMSTAALMKSINDAISQVILRKKIEEQREEMELFSYTVAHDLKSPLRSISVFSKLVSDNVQGKISDQVDSHLEMIQAQAGQMVQLIEDLLNYANLSRSSKPLLPVELKSVVETARHQLQNALTESGVNLKVGPLPLVQGDRITLQQLMFNLIDNAIKYRHPGRAGEIHITAREVEGACEISVRDNGVGIPAQFHTDVFTPLRRVHNGDQEGSGIGLAICKRIVAQHKGKIWVKSAPDEGATFTFTLPEVSSSPIF